MTGVDDVGGIPIFVVLMIPICWVTTKRYSLFCLERMSLGMFVDALRCIRGA